MSVGMTGESQILLLIVCIVGIVVVPLFLYVLALITSLIRRFLHIDLSILWTFALFVGIPAALLGASLAIDTVGQTRMAQVIRKTEPVRLHSADGTWSQGITLEVRYDVKGQPLPPFTEYVMAVMDAQRAGGTVEIASLSPSVEDFDKLHAGDTYAVRFVRVADVASLVRPADQSTWTAFPWLWIEGAIMVAGMFILAYRLRKTPLGYWPLAILILIGLTIPPLQGFYLWRQRDDLSADTQHASAQVQNVTRIPSIFLGRGSRGSRYDLSQPFDIVQLTFTPPGYPDPVTVVDAVDVDARQPSPFDKDASVDIVYAADDPRDARIVGQTRTHHLRTPLQVYTDNALLLVLFAAMLVGLSLGSRWLSQALASRRPTPP